MSADNPLLGQFCQFSAELDARNDRSERIVKLSRDITIESKRTICLLQRTQFQCATERSKIIEKAEGNLAKIRKYNFSKLARELENESPFYFNRCYTFGLQEYIEALSFCHYLKHGTLVCHGDVQKGLVFKEPRQTGRETEGSKEGEGNANEGSGEAEKPTSDSPKSISVHVSQHDFMLGLLDLTGELMRVATNANPLENLDFIVDTCKFLQLIHQGSSAFYGYRSKEFSRKLSTLMTSVSKLETLVYNLKIREMDAFGGSITVKPLFVDNMLEGDHGKGRNFDEYDSGTE